MPFNSISPENRRAVAAKAGVFGEDCLSVFCEFHSRPPWRAAQGTRQGGESGRTSLRPNR